MQVFKDQNGRQWSVAITLGSARRLKANGFDLQAAIDGKLLERLYSDVFSLGAFLWVLCEEQAKTAGISEEQFAEGFAGDAINVATDAVIEEIISFFPSARRNAIQKAWQKMQAIEGRTLALALEKIGAIDPDQMAAQLLDGKNSVGNSQASSGSTPPA